MLLAIVTISNALSSSYDEWQPETPLRDISWRMNCYLANIPNPEDEDVFSQFIRENPPPSARCLYFIEIFDGEIPHLVYIESTFRQSAHDRLKPHEVNAKLVKTLQESPGTHIFIRYGDIQADYTQGTLPPDPEPLWTFPEDEQERIIRDVEAALIFKLKPDFNMRNKASYRGYPIRVELVGAPWPGIPTRFSFTSRAGDRRMSNGR